MRTLLAALALLFGSPAASEDCRFLSDFGGRFIAEVTIEGHHIPLEMAFEDYQFMQLDACEAWGLATDDVCTTYPLMGDLGWNAMATTCSGVPKVLYDRRLSSQLGYAGAQAVLAHELGHLLCGHVQKPVNAELSNHTLELEADRFAGATMRLLGFSMKEALGYLPLLSGLPSFSHPSAEERALALAAGWQDPSAQRACLR